HRRLREQEGAGTPSMGAFGRWWTRHRRTCPVHAPAERCALMLTLDADRPRVEAAQPRRDYWSEALARVRAQEGRRAPTYAQLKLEWWPRHRAVCPRHAP